MSEEKKSEGVTGTVSGWVKAVITSVIGLASGAFIMYLTPMVNNAIKPAKPVANFATHATGLTVEVNNRSTGAVQGWWDFGDGSALEPFEPKTEIAKHVYAKPGTYTVKLSLQNLLGEESDRSAPVSLDPDTAPKPEVETFNLIRVSPSDSAPAMFHFVSKVKNASYSILSLGDSRPTEIVDDVNHQRIVTFEKAGSYTVRLAAVNGKQLAEKTQTVSVSANDGRDIVAKLSVTYEAARVERFPPSDWPIHCGWHVNVKDAVCPIRLERIAAPDLTILSAELVTKDEKSSPARKLAVQISPDKRRIILTGELVKPGGFLTPKTAPPHWVAHVNVMMERRTPPEMINRGDVMMAVNLNRATKIPLQPLDAGYEVRRKQVNLELWDGSRKVWETNKAVTNATVLLKNQTCMVTAISQNDGMVLTIATPIIGAVTIPSALPTQPVGPVIRPAGFQRNPLLPGRP
jgi:PKD repeat protein